MLAVTATVVAIPASAQMGGYDGQQFVAAISKGDTNTALQLIHDTPTLVNARDLDGQTALIAAIENRDTEWTGYLLKEGANPNLANNDGVTPLMAAAKAGYPEAVDWLIGLGAKLDETNRMGETALILAVQRRHIPIVRALVKAGSNPDITDSAQGFSARDYARRDSRTPEMLKIIEAKKPAP
ncbi:MAG TPA: ankyrin repeat domain-containing protein [Sphingomicrobium sp.]|jgi:ankyrin repeat protein|nr:ankyrin repeat domain-containing protein [Sphingomicrobium sp.]